MVLMISKLITAQAVSSTGLTKQDIEKQKQQYAATHPVQQGKEVTENKNEYYVSPELKARIAAAPEIQNRHITSAKPPLGPPPTNKATGPATITKEGSSANAPVSKPAPAPANAKNGALVMPTEVGKTTGQAVNQKTVGKKAAAAKKPTGKYTQTVKSPLTTTQTK